MGPSYTPTHKIPVQIHNRAINIFSMPEQITAKREG